MNGQKTRAHAILERREGSTVPSCGVSSKSRACACILSVLTSCVCFLKSIVWKQEPMSRSLQLPYKAYVTALLQTDLFLVHLVYCERKAVPVQWRSDVNLCPVIGYGTPPGVSFKVDFDLKTSNNHRLESAGLNAVEELLRYVGNAQRR